MGSIDEPIPYWKQQEIAEYVTQWFEGETKRERVAAEQTRQIADAHREGWKLVAKSINEGFRMVADAIRDNRR